LIGEHFEEEGETRLRDIVTFIEPMITIAMGLVVAIVVAAVMLPMFDMATFAKG
jgi:type II secretory pathway component PulF